MIAPGYGVNGAEGTLGYSMPGFDGNGRPAWDFGFTAAQGGDVTFYIRCLNRWVATAEGHSHELWLSHPDKWFNDRAPTRRPAHSHDIDCSDEAKGIVAGWDFEYGLWMLGNDPQPKSALVQDPQRLGLGQGGAHRCCCASATGPAPTRRRRPAQHVRRQDGQGPQARAPSCRVTGVLPGRRLRRHRRAARRRLRHAGRSASKSRARSSARGNVQDHRPGTVTARVKVSRRYRGALASGQIGRVTAVVRKDNGKVAKRRCA